MKEKGINKLYDKLLQSEDGIEEGLSKAASILASIDYIGNSRVRNSIRGLNVAIGAGMAAHAVFQYLREARENSMYSLSVDDLDEVTYDVANDLMKDNQKVKDVKSYTVRSKHEPIPFSNKMKNILTTESDQDSVVRISLGGYEYQVVSSIPEPPQKGESQKTAYIGIRKITFYSKKSEAIEFMKKELQDRVDSVMKGGITPLIYTNGDYSFNSTELRVRPIDSIVLKEGQIEQVTGHINRFLEDEELHNKYGLPYHTGILLKGPPGTGKTSLATGLASHFQMNLYQISLSDIDGDSDLNETFSGIRSRSIVVLEDLDVLGSTNLVDRDAEYEKESVTMSGLLNVLDGNMTPHGMILIATTNHADSIDPAIVRSGRVDLTMTLDYMDNVQLENLVKFFTNKKYDFPDITEEDEITSSDVSGIFRTHLKNPEGAIEEIRTMIEMKKAKVVIEEEVKVD